MMDIDEKQIISDQVIDGILDDMEPKTAQYLIDKTGFNSDYAKAILRRNVTRLNADKKGKELATYCKSDLDAIADFYIAGIKPMQVNEWDRDAIARHFKINEHKLRKLVADKKFPAHKRVFINTNGARHKKLWDAKVIKKLKLESFGDYMGNIVEVDKKTITLTQEGDTGLVLKFLMGGFDDKERKRRYENRLIYARSREVKTQVVNLIGVL